jgi:hypothetical protein
MHGPTFNALLLIWCGALTAAEPANPAAMAPKLAKITPEMIARITAACPAEPGGEAGAAAQGADLLALR